MRRWLVGGGIVLGVALTVAALWLLTLNGTLRDDPFVALSIFTVAAYTAMGCYLTAKVPGNPIGPLFLAAGLGLLFSGALTEYATYGFVTNPGRVPFPIFAAWVNNWTYITAGIIPMVLVLFPTGRVPTPGWRWVPVTLVSSLIALTLATMIRPGAIEVTEAVHRENPVGIDAIAGPLTVIVWGAGLALLAASIGSVIALIVRLRTSAGEERQQVRWLAAVGGLTGISLIAVLLTSIGLPSGGSSTANDLAFLVFFLCLSIGIPAAVTVALLKHRLYDLDIVIKKTVLYVTIAGILVVVFVAAGVIVAGVFGRSERAAVVAAGVIGLLFWPSLGLARRVADRLVYGGRATPYEVLSSFGKRMSETYATDDVLQRTAQLLGSATGASRAVVWLRVGREFRPSGVWPADDHPPPAPSMLIDHDQIPDLPGDWAEPVHDRGDLLGALAVTMPANDPIGPGRQQLMRDLADQAGLALRNVRLIEELRASRQRLVVAQDEERRRLERNIHDGVQQQLVALAVKLRLAEGFVERDPARARDAIASLQLDAGAALDDLRDLARGIYPPLLADKGLHAALEAQARKATTPVTLDADGLGRYPRNIEATVYFCVLEALNNIAKYADATRVTLHLARREDDLTFSVHDDGRGFDPVTVVRGTGLQGMADRLDSVGGSIEISSGPRSGTTVMGTVPVGDGPTS